MFDSFVADLRCPSCETVLVDGEIQTHIRADASCFRVGDELEPADVYTTNILESDYDLVQLPRPGSSIQLLDMWWCRTCKTEQWALIEITGRRIKGIKSVILTRGVLGKANFISSINVELLAALLARTNERPPAVSSVEMILAYLPKE